jgi:aryl-alcohol dehydrogenase-like predicted oxidoreductase
MVVGAKNAAQLSENLGSVEIMLDANEIAALSDACPRSRRWPAWQIEMNEASRLDVN